MPVQPFGQADPAYDALRVPSNQAIWNGPNDSGGLPGGGLENKIYVWHSDGSTIETYDPDEAGAIAACAAQASGDTVWFPSIPIALTTPITITAGGALIGISHNAALSFSGFSGAAITLGAGALVTHCAVSMISNGADAIGVNAQAAGARVEHVDITVSGGSTRNVRVLTGVNTSPTIVEMWSIDAAAGVLWAETTGAAGDSPAWHTIALPTGYVRPEQAGWGHTLQTDHLGHYLYVCGKDSGNSNRATLWQLDNLAAIRAAPATAPSWTAIAYKGMSTSEGTLDTAALTASFYNHAFGDTLYFRAMKNGGGSSPILGKYNGMAWTWRSGAAGNNNYQAVNGEVYAALNGVGGSSYLYDWDDAQIGAAFNLVFGLDHFSEMWRRFDVASHYHFPFPKTGTLVLREQATATEVSLPNTVPNSQDHTTVRGAYTSDAIYCVDSDSDLQVSADGLTFSTIANWKEGWVLNTVMDGSGNLLWFVKQQTGSNPVVRLYDTAGNLLADLTGDLWTVLGNPGGTIDFDNFLVVYADTVTSGDFPIIADLHSGSATGTGAADVEIDGAAIVLDSEFTTLQVDSGTAYVRDVAYTTKSGSGTLEPVQSDRGVFDALAYQTRHANDIDEAGGVHHTQDALDGLYQPLDTTLTAIAGLADAAGVLTNDGAGALSWETASSTDANAIHDNVAGEIHAITEKVTPVDADEIIIEDSEDTYSKKRVQIANLPTGGGSIGGSTGATDNAVLRADGAGGATVQNSLMTVDDSGGANIPTGQQYKVNNAQHTHVEADMVFANNTTGDADTTQHGFMQKYSGDTSKFLRADGTFQSVSSSGGGWDDVLATAYALMFS